MTEQSMMSDRTRTDSDPDREIPWNPYAQDCPTRKVLDVIGYRWSILIVGTLADGPQRFNQISKTVVGISQKVLTQTLRRLERDGVVTRTIYPQIPPRVEYELTPVGETLIPVLAAVQEWSKAYMSVIFDARREYDETSADARSLSAPVPLARASVGAPTH